MNYYLQSVYLTRVMLLAAMDAITLVISSAAAWWLVEPDLPLDLYIAATAAGTLLTFLALFTCDAYSPSVIGDGRRTFASLTSSVAIAFAVGVVFYYAVTVPADVVPCLVRTATFYFPLILLERAVFRGASCLARTRKRVLIIGTNPLAKEIAKSLHGQKNAGLEPIGFLSDDPDYDHLGATFADCALLGRTHHLEKILASTKIDHIVVASVEGDEHYPGETLQRAKVNGLRVWSGVAFLERACGKIYLRDLHPGYLVYAEGFRMGSLGSVMKRAVDIVLSAMALVVILPVLAICAVAIKLESRGPVLFRQTRLGQMDKPFEILKLRSMREDAEAVSGAVFAIAGDPRITRVGHFIRKTRLDEFPQLWNILRGDMTLVGPRAERPEFVEMLNERYVYYRLRSSVKPGLTGWAQTRYGYVNDVDAYEEKLALDFYYLKHRSVAMDLLILWQTMKTVLLARGL